VVPGAEADVPLWLTRPLLRRSMASIKLPPVYSERYQRKLNAGADCVSLKSMVRRGRRRSGHLSMRPHTRTRA